MSERPWYREPESFIALAALVVSISAVAVGLYEAALQRSHDRAEVFPRLSIATFTSPSGATISLVNGGIGPALVDYITVSVDGKPQKDWAMTLATLLGRDPGKLSNATANDQSVRAGDAFQLVGIPNYAMPPDFWKSIARVSILVCYESVFHDAWTIGTKSLGAAPQVRKDAKSCPAQASEASF